MIPTGQHIARNTTYLTAAYIFQKIFAFIYFTLIARWIGAEDIGQYIFAVSLTTIMSVFVDFGLSNVLIREAAKFREKANSYLNSILSVKVLFSIVAYAAVVIIINVLDKPAIVQIMVYLAGLVMITDAFSLSFWSIFRGFQNLRYESISIGINQILILAVGIAGVLLQFPIWILIVALLCGSMFSLVYSLVLIKTKLKFKLRFEWNKSTLGLLFRIAIPFALAGIFTRVYSYIDQVLLSVLIGDKELGWYGVAYKLTFALQFIPAAFAAAVYPAMSSFYIEAKDKLKTVFDKSMFLLMILSIPISVGIITLADSIILALYTSEYEASIVALQILISALVFIFMGYPVGAILNSCDRQAINTMNMGITMVVNIILNLILIPRYLHIGASIAALVSLGLLFFLNLCWVPKIINIDGRFLLVKLLKTCVCAAIMGAVIIILKPMIHFVLLIFIGAAVYGLLLFLIRGFTREDLHYIYESVFKRST